MAYDFDGIFQESYRLSDAIKGNVIFNIADLYLFYFIYLLYYPAFLYGKAILSRIIIVQSLPSHEKSHPCKFRQFLKS